MRLGPFACRSRRRAPRASSRVAPSTVISKGSPPVARNPLFAIGSIKTGIFIVPATPGDSLSHGLLSPFHATIVPRRTIYRNPDFRSWNACRSRLAEQHHGARIPTDSGDRFWVLGERLPRNERLGIRRADTTGITTVLDIGGHPRFPGTREGGVIRCHFIFSGKNDELPSREGAPGGLDRASGFPFPL